MPHITVRRYQGDADRSSSDFDVRSEDLRHLDRCLQVILRAAQAERGVGLWSGADPEIWKDALLVGQLRPADDIAELAHRAIAMLRCP